MAIEIEGTVLDVPATAFEDVSVKGFAEYLRTEGEMSEPEARRFIEAVLSEQVMELGDTYLESMRGHVQEIQRLRGELRTKYDAVLDRFRQAPGKPVELPPELEPEAFRDLFNQLADEIEALKPPEEAIGPVKDSATAKELKDALGGQGEAPPEKPPSEPPEGGPKGPPPGGPPVDPKIQALRDAVAGKPLAEQGLAKLESGGHQGLIDELDDLIEKGDPTGSLEQISSLTDQQLEGLAEVQRVQEEMIAGRDWFDVLDLDPAYRAEMLDLIADVKDVVDSGLGEAISRGINWGEYGPQGALGHLFAARTLRGIFPDARFDFEVPVTGPRDIDIVVKTGGRTIDVEVKTPDPLSDPRVPPRQIRRDLLNHLGDPTGPWEDLMYLFPPEQGGRIGMVENSLLNALDDAYQNPAVQKALAARGIMTQADAEAALLARFNNYMVGTYGY